MPSHIVSSRLLAQWSVRFCSWVSFCLWRESKRGCRFHFGSGFKKELRCFDGFELEYFSPSWISIFFFYVSAFMSLSLCVCVSVCMLCAYVCICACVGYVHMCTCAHVRCVCACSRLCSCVCIWRLKSDFRCCSGVIHLGAGEKG